MEGVKNSVSKVSRIHSLAQDFLTQKLAEQGLLDFASSHGNILFQLSLTDQMPLGELAQKINRDKSTATVLVRKLEKEGFVILTPDKIDRRKKFVSLTQKGRDYNARTAKISEELADTFFDGFSEDEKNSLYNFLSRIEGNFSK